MVRSRANEASPGQQRNQMKLGANHRRKIAKAKPIGQNGFVTIALRRSCQFESFLGRNENVPREFPLTFEFWLQPFLLTVNGSRSKRALKHEKASEQLLC
jgi:hypothetical protein